MNQTTKPIAVGIIGTGRHGSRYANHIINDVDELRLAAISRRSEAGPDQARRWQVRCHPDWRSLVDDSGVEAVIAATTPNLNPEIAQLCARAGKPLLLEKPLAIDPGNGARIIETFARSGLPLTIAQTLRYNPTIRALGRHLHLAGRLYCFHANQRLEPSEHPWLEEPAVAGGGVILHAAVHLFDALRFITGREVTRVLATMYRRHNPRLEDLSTALIEMEGELTGTVDASKVGPGRSGRYEFVGAKGQLHGDQVHGTLDLIRQATSTPLERHQPENAIVPLLTDWAECLRGRGRNPIPAAEGLVAVRVCEACRRSALENRWIRVQND